MVILALDSWLLYSHASLCPRRAWGLVVDSDSCSYFLLQTKYLQPIYLIIKESDKLKKGGFNERIE